MTSSLLVQIEKTIQIVPNFPKPGITFYNISTLLQNPFLKEKAFDFMHQQISHLPVDIVVAIDSRGFITGTALSSKDHCNVSLVMIRKPSKLPGDLISATYNLEYKDGSTLQLERNVIKPGDYVIISDDLIASGGSLIAAVRLVRESGGIVIGCSVVIELSDLGGRKLLNQYGINLYSLLQMDKSGNNVTPSLFNEAKILSQEQRLITSSGRNHSRVLLYHPTARSLVNSIRMKYPYDFEIIEPSFNKYPDGSPNIDFFSNQYLKGVDVLYVGNLDNLNTVLEQQVFLIAVSRQGLKSLTIVFPYLKTATDERIERSGKVAFVEPFVKILSSSLQMTASGPPTIQLFDVHTTPTQFYFDLTVVNVRMLTAVSLIKNEIKKYGNRVVLAFPDQGSEKRFKSLFADMNLRHIICSKVREGDKRFIRILEGADFDVSSFDHIFLIDDLVMSGSTLDECRKSIAIHYPEPIMISAYVTHAVFPNDSWRNFLSTGKFRGFHKFYITNTIPHTCAKLYNRDIFIVLDISDIIIDGLTPSHRIVPFYYFKVYLASTNQDKKCAIQTALTRVLSGTVDIIVHGYNIPSGVSEQPLYEATLLGCQNRWKNLKQSVEAQESPNANFKNCIFVSIENGLVRTSDGDCDIACVAVSYGKDGDPYYSMSPLVKPPPEIVARAKAENKTVGEILQKEFGFSKSNWQPMYDPEHRTRSELTALAIQEALIQLIQFHR